MGSQVEKRLPVLKKGKSPSSSIGFERPWPIDELLILDLPVAA